MLRRFLVKIEGGFAPPYRGGVYLGFIDARGDLRFALEDSALTGWLQCAYVPGEDIVDLPRIPGGYVVCIDCLRD